MATPYAGRPDPSRREPLWSRVDRNRFRLVGYLIAFAFVTSLFVAAGVAAAALLAELFARGGTVPSDGGNDIARWLLSDFPWRPWYVAVLIAIAYEVWALARSEKWLLKRLGARFVPKGELLDTKMALKDMAIAAGLPVAPALHALPTSNVNAFVFKAPGRRPVLGVTEGLLDRLDADERRAVFANLVARLVSGDTMVSSAVTSLLAPLQWYRAHRIQALEYEDRVLRAAAEERRLSGNAETSQAVPVSWLFTPLLIPLAIVSELIAAAQRRSQLTAAEKADAEGMLLLKDPQSMLSALERCVRVDNVVVSAGESLGDLFYCWTGDSTDDEDDPEWRRVARLREVLGVDGWVPEEPVPIDDVSDLVPPPAPRLTRADERSGE